MWTLGISFLFNQDIPKGIGWFVLLLAIAIGGLFLALTYPMYYEITPTTLLVRSGLLRVEIPLHSIQQVFPERYWRSAPAWSLDRLRVDYRTRWGARFVHIAPKDQFRFMRDLVEHDQDLEVKNGRVVRRH